MSLMEGKLFFGEAAPGFFPFDCLRFRHLQIELQMSSQTQSRTDRCRNIRLPLRQDFLGEKTVLKQLPCQSFSFVSWQDGVWPENLGFTRMQIPAVQKPWEKGEQAAWFGVAAGVSFLHGVNLEVGGIPLDFRFGSPYLSLTVDSRNWSGRRRSPSRSWRGTWAFPYRNFLPRSSVMMAGCFEGLYGSRSEAESVDKGHYELSAAAQFQGLLHGSVDFGIIGASVSVELFAQANLMLKSDEATQVTLGFHVQASAKVKVAFIRISFGFSLNGCLHFSLGGSGQRLAERGERRRRPLLLPAADGSKGEYTLRLAPVFSMLRGQPCVNLFLLMDNADFKDMLRQLSSLLQSTDEGEPVCGLELFDRLHISGPRESCTGS